MAEPDDAFVPMVFQRLILRDRSEQQWIYLGERDGQRGFPIVIGAREAQEIHRVLHDARSPRPMTHQLTQAALESLGARVERVDIVDLRSNTFYADLVVRDAQGVEHHLDARPSDALAIGLRAGCTLRVAESVLEQVRTDESGPDPLDGADPGTAEGTDAPGDEDSDEAPGPGPDLPPNL